MIGAANDVRDAHVVVVDDDGEIVRWVAVRAQDDQVVEILVRKDNAALHVIIDDRLALARCLETDDGLHVLRRVFGIAVAPGRQEDLRTALGLGLFARGLDLGRR